MKIQQKAERVKILNTYIDNISSLNLLKKIKDGGVLFTPNVDHLVKLQKDVHFYHAYRQADYVVCDSQILLWISKLLNSQIREKISGSDFFSKFYQYYQNDESIKIFLLGGMSGVAEEARQKINQKVNRPIVVGAYSPSLDFDKNKLECQEIVNKINKSGATVLAVGVGAPKQEKWINEYKDKLSGVKIFLAIGATIDFEAEVTQRSPQWISSAGLEWLHRLILDPKRLWKRYLVDSLPFFLLVTKQRLNLYKDLQSTALWQEPTHLLENSYSEPKKAVNVLMFGPCLSEQGGMGTVQKHIVNSVKNEVNIKHITTWDGKRNTFGLFSKALIKFWTRLVRDEVDLVHLHVSERGSVLRKSILASLASAFSKPVIMHTHGCEFHVFYDRLPAMGQGLLNRAFRNCDRIIVLSKSWKQTYIDKCGLQPNRVLVKYNPVTIPKNTPNRNNCDKITFLIVGKINQRKGIYDLLNAVAQLEPLTREKIELIIAGSGETEQAIALAKKLEIDSLVSFPGWINAQQRDLLLEKANVFVLPSYNEGLPMALLEAMSWSLPVITTPVGGIPEVVIHQETGLLIEPGDVTKLAASIQALIEDKSLRKRLGKAAYKKALLCDLTTYRRDILDLYHSMVTKNKQ